MRNVSLSGLFRLATAGAFLLVSTAACSSADENANTGTPEAPRHEKVQLPPVPALPLLDLPRTYADGSHSVMGVLIERDKLMLKTITVSGMIVDVYECEVPEEPSNARRSNDRSSEDENTDPRPGCLYPHFYVADTPDSPKRILVTGYDASHYEPQLQPMTRYRVTGHYSVQARGFSSSETGLLVADEIAGSGIVQPNEEQ